MMSLLSDASRIVVKLGSAMISDDQFNVRTPWLDALVQDVVEWRNAGREVILVSSGAVTLGRGQFDNLPRDISGHDLPLETKQALAACGQNVLAHAYHDAFGRQGVLTGQMLLTRQDSDIRSHYLNARNALFALLELGVVPIINENDSVTTEGIRVGDNDRLAASVASLASADVLVLLSDIDGLYTADPSQNPAAQLIPEITDITPEIEAMAGTARTAVGTGGMATKIEAAKLAMQAGCHMVITNGHALHPLKELEDGAPCSWFVSHGNPLSSRKRWIAGALQPAGNLVIDEGAVRALQEGNSLLPVGVVRVEGQFARGETVAVLDEGGLEVARGLCSYTSDEAVQIAGLRGDGIESVLGYQPRSAMIHRDDLVFNG